MPSITLSGKVVDGDSPCYVIAEIGNNHGGNFQTCLDMIYAAKECGADAVKFQRRTNRELYTPAYYNAPYNSPHSYGKTYGEHREALELGEAQYPLLKDYCKQLKIGFGVTPFDLPAAKFVARLGVDFIKIASGDLYYKPLLEEVTKFNTPVILSTGGARSLDEIGTAYRTLRKQRDYGPDVAILHCTSAYPAEFDQLNLRVIGKLRERFPAAVVGWSNHSRGISQFPTAYALGARIIETHFTLDRTAKGTDQAFSLEPKGLAEAIRYLEYARQALGTGVKVRYPEESEALKKQWKNANGKIGTEEDREAIEGHKRRNRTDGKGKPQADTL
jgi:N-acetylneuraminate synthase/sialic acid synthase